MANKTRKQTREAIGAMLNSAMVGAGKTCEASFDYLPPKFEGKSPVICIGSGGTLGMPYTLQGLRPVYHFEIIAFVAREDEQDSEDELDNVSQELYNTLEANISTANWESIDYDGRSEIAPANVGGDPYWMEVTPVMVTVT